MTLPSERIQKYDLGQVFATAGQAMQLQHMQRQNQRQQEIDAALQAGDMQRWAQLDPAGAAKYQQTMREGQKSQLDMAKTQQSMLNDRAKRTQEESQLMSNTLAQNPRAGDFFRKRFDMLQQQGVIDPIDVPGLERMAPDVAGPPDDRATPDQIATSKAMAGIENPYARPTEHAREFFNATGMTPEQAPPGAYNAWLAKYRKDGAASTSVNVSAGNQGLTMASRTEAQGKVATNRMAMESLNDIDATIRPEFFTYEGQMKRKYLSVKAKAGAKLSEDDQGYLADFRDASEGIGGMFNIVRREVTGAGAALAELEKMKDTAINMDMDYPSFIASYNRAKRITQRTLAFNQKMLDEGIPVADREARMNAEAVRIVAEEREGKRRQRREAQAPSVTPQQRAVYDAELDGAK